MISVLAVTPDDPTPAYEQLRRHLVDLIEGGQFVEGERRPPLTARRRPLGSLWAPLPGRITSSKPPAWVRSRRGGGTRVAAGQPPRSTRERARRLDELAVTFAAKVKAVGASEEEIHEAVNRSLV